MPTYGYKFENCSHEFEAFQNIKDTPLEQCILCDGHVERQLFAVFSKIARDTVGKLAEKNTKRMGGKLQTEESDKKAKAKAHMRELNCINKMSASQKQTYIERG